MLSSSDGSPLTEEEEYVRGLTGDQISGILTAESVFSSMNPEDEKSKICDAIVNFSSLVEKMRNILSPNPSFPKRQMEAFFKIFDEILNISESVKGKKVPLDSLIDIYKGNCKDISRVCLHFNPEHLADYFFGKNEVISMMKTSQKMHEKSLKAYLDKRRDAKVIIKLVISHKQLSDVDSLLKNLDEMEKIAQQFFELTDNFDEKNKGELAEIFNDMKRKIIQLRAFIIIEQLSTKLNDVVVGGPDPMILKIQESVRIPEPINSLFSAAKTTQQVNEVYEEFKKKENFMMGHRVVDLFLEMCRLSFLVNRVEILLVNDVYSYEMREFFTKLNDLLLKYFDPYSECASLLLIHEFQQQVDELLKMIDIIDFGSHATKAFSKSDIIVACLKKIYLLFEDIEHCLNFVQLIGKQMQDPARPVISIIVNPVLKKADKAKFGLITMENIDVRASSILLYLQSRLPRNGVDEEFGDGYHMTEKDLIIPDLSSEFLLLLSFMKKEKFQILFNNNFYFNLQAILSCPVQEVTVRKGLKECSRVFLTNEFANGEQPLDILEALTKIHNSYIWIAALSYFDVIDFTAGINLMYARTFLHMIFNTDMMPNSKLTQSIADFEGLASKIEEIDCQFDSEKSRESINIVKENVACIIDKIFSAKEEESIEKLASIVEWMLNVESGNVSSCSEASLSFDVGVQPLSQAMHDLSERSAFNTKMERAIFFLRDLFNEESSQKTDVPELVARVVSISKQLIDEGILIVPSKFELSSLNAENFAEFRSLFVLKMDQIIAAIHLRIRELLDVAGTVGEEVFLSFDRLIRGSLGAHDLALFIKNVSRLQCEKENIVDDIKKQTHLLIKAWQFMNAVDEIADITCDEQTASILRIFNMNQFLQFFTNQVLYLSTAISSINSASEESNVTVNVHSNAMNIKRMMKKSEERKEEISMNVCKEIRHIESEFSKVDQGIFIKKTRQILSHAASVLGDDEATPIFEVFDGIIINVDHEKEKYMELFNCITEYIKPNMPQYLSQIISSLNTSILFLQTRSDICSFFSILETKGKEVPLVQSFVLFDHNGGNASVRIPTLPFQVGFEKHNEDFVNYCYTNQRGAAAALISDTAIVQEDQITPPQQLLSLEDQNTVAQILIEEQNTHKILSREGSVSSGDPNVAALAELTALKTEVQEAEAKQLELREKLKNSITMWKSDLRSLVKLHEATSEEVDNMKADFSDFAGFTEKRDAVAARVERKKKELERLKDELASYVNFTSLSNSLESDNKAYHEISKNRSDKIIKSIDSCEDPIEAMKESLCEYVPPKEEEVKKEKAPSPPKMGRIPPSIAPYCHLPGLFPAATRQAVEADVEELMRVGDSKELMKKFGEMDVDKISQTMHSRANRIATANIVEKQADLARRIAILNEILSDN